MITKVRINKELNINKIMAIKIVEDVYMRFCIKNRDENIRKQLKEVCDDEISHIKRSLTLEEEE